MLCITTQAVCETCKKFFLSIEIKRQTPFDSGNHIRFTVSETCQAEKKWDIQ